MAVYRNYYRPGGTDVALADGGTGASLSDPNADRIMFWDDSAGAVTWLTASTGLTISGTSITASGSGSNTINYESRSSNTILGTSDSGKVIDCTASFTQTFTAAATLGAGWYVIIAATGPGTVVTLDPNASELIGGLTTQKLSQGTMVLVSCNGSAFFCKTLQGVFTPEDIPGLCAWYDASDSSTITSVAGAVSQWNDKSGNGYNVTQSTGSAKPTTGTRTINSINVLDFDGGDTLRNASVHKESAYAIYAVIEPDTVSGTDLILHSGVTGTADWSFFLNAGVLSYFGGSATATGPTLSASTPVLVAQRLASHVGTGYVRSGGTNGSDVNPGAVGFSSIDIGNTDTGSNFFDGKIAEILWCANLVGPQHDFAIRNYLANKWGVTA